MGLDMFAYKVPKKFALSDLRIDKEFFENYKGDDEFMYWRKHWDLHKWMENLYYAKGGKGEFNCAVVRLTLDDLTSLRKTIAENRLSNGGFDLGWYTKRDDLAFIDKAIQAIEDGYEIYYDSWW